ncbi:hypothetical protein [Thermus scotoductus]|uniref:hypothetical protein n=1 Tax=Thermus scotoductus TaxID=37636 RepID=UPI0020A315D2|nr:hypothetical protein [Thermus scotoductus]
MPWRGKRARLWLDARRYAKEFPGRLVEKVQGEVLVLKEKGLERLGLLRRRWFWRRDLCQAAPRGLKVYLMGHSHSWRIKPEVKGLLEKRMGEILEGQQRLLPHLPPLAGGNGEGRPLLALEEVVFNGRVPQDYETFAFPGHFGEWNFCKTGPSRERKRPYDLAVRVFLLIAKLHLGKP